MNSEFGIVVPPAAAIGIYAELINTILQGRPPSAARRHGTKPDRRGRTKFLPYDRDEDFPAPRRGASRSAREPGTKPDAAGRS